MHPSPAISHERGADFGLGAHGSKPSVPQPMDGIVQMLDVGPADAEDIFKAPLAQRHHQGVRQYHRSCLPMYGRLDISQIDG